MNANFQLSRPEQKHGEADAIRHTDLDITNLTIYQTIASAINDCKGCIDTAPVTLFGITTWEYCIVSCPHAESEPNVGKVIQYLRGQGYFADIYRLSETLENPSKYRQAILVCWDPKIIQSSLSPKYYSSRDGVKIPCSQCNKQRTGTVASCEGCATVRVWLAGVSGLRHQGDPCDKCSRAKASKQDGEASCECPVKNMWVRLYSNETAEEPANQGDTNEDESVKDTSSK